MKEITLGLVVGLALLQVAGAAEQARLPIFDAHVHYSAPAWKPYPPERIKRILDRAGVRWALVSSSPDEGTLALRKADPERVVAELRPYHDDVNLGSWVGHPDVFPYLEDRLARGEYVGIGEFHVSGAEADQRLFLGRVAGLATKHRILLHVHSGSEPVEMVFEMEPGLTILWAHAGLSEPPEVVDRMLRTHNRLYADTSFRGGDIAPGGSISTPWRDLLIRHQDRFLVGTDTYTTGRWDAYETLVAGHRRWLAQLPEDVAVKIAYKNALKLFGMGGD